MNDLKNLTAAEILSKGVDYLYSFNDEQRDYEKAMFCFIQALDAGNIKAYDEIGAMYECGYGVEKNKIEAANWYKRGAAEGDTNSMHSLASCFQRGSGVEKNIDAAVYWYKKSAELGNKNSMDDLAKILLKYKQNETEAFQWLKKFYDGKEFDALKSLAHIYYFEMPTTAENNLRTLELYKKISEQDESYCAYIGEMYLEGRGVEKSGRKSVKWFKKAAAAGDVSAMFELAKIYIKGEYWLKDETAALELLTKRNDGNKIEGMYELAHIYYGKDERADKSLIDKNRAFYWFRKLYTLNNLAGTYFYGKMWEEKSASAALEIYKDGVKLGDADCCKRIIQLYLEGVGEIEKNIPEAARWVVKYFCTANEAFCTCPFCSPFEEMKQIAKFFIETPREELIKLYKDERLFAAREIYKFGQACNESPVNIFTTLEIISLAADLMGDKCSPELLEQLSTKYEEIYQDVKNNEVAE